MNKFLFSASLVLLPFLGDAQIFQEDFDGNGPGIGAWSLITDNHQPANDVSFITNAWNRIDRLGGNGNFGGPAGNFAAMTTSWFNPVGTADRWLITPEINLPATKAILKWEAKAQDANNRDGYKVMLSTNGGTAKSDFDVTLFSISAEDAAWKARTVLLENYFNKKVRIAFVDNSTDMYMLLVDNVKVELVPTQAPDCAVVQNPSNGAQNVPYASVNLQWTPPTGGGAVASYDVFLDTNPNPTTLKGNTDVNTYALTALTPETTYYWKVVPKNVVGSATNCQVYSFKTAVASYCTVPFSSVEPITNITFAGINNTTSASTSAPAHELFLDKIAMLNPGQSYTISAEGNTGGDWTDSFWLYIDWNQNKSFDDPGERYSIGNLVNSTGTDGKKVTATITVPTNALPGTTRMRVIKKFQIPEPTNSCTPGRNFGQTEDYGVQIATLGVKDIAKNTVKAYPNPIKNFLTIDTASKIKAIKVFDLSGKLLHSQAENAKSSKLSFVGWAKGLYIVNLIFEDGNNTNLKVIKD